MESQAVFSQNARRKVLNAALSSIVHESGFGYAEKVVFETLLEMLQAFICELGRSSRSYCELAARTDVLVGDVVVALVEMGMNVDSIPVFGRTLFRSPKVVIPAPTQAPKANQPKILQAGEKKQLHSYIPDYLPPFPDPHSYIRTPTHKQPVTEYEAIREKAASQKRDVERALTRFMAKTSSLSSAHSLFPDEHMSSLFPLISLETSAVPYVSSLLPKDQVFEDDEAEEEAAKSESEKISETNNEDAAANAADNGERDDSADPANAADGNQEAKADNNQAADSDVPDNPYLRPAKISKKISATLNERRM
ncbi:Transcription initiation factor TFIID subunit 8 [Halotydeus destructor]|nr:Transcription initiation factor TFIID subunit 8 [Halotydeus destructor]